MRAIHNVIDPVQSLTPAARVNGTANGTGVDLANAAGVAVVFNVGTITDGTHAPKIQDSADNSTFADVAAADQVGSLVNLVASSVQKVGYVGSKRYIRPVITTSGATTGGVSQATVVRFPLRKQPG